MLPVAAAFLSSGAVMILEIAAGRILAPIVGVSIYTWTSLIGVILGGLALGSGLGGWLADRLPARRLLAGALLLAALGALALLPLSGARPLPDWLGVRDAIGQLIWLAAALALVPSLALGAVFPAAARLAVRDLGTSGSSVGALYAAGSLGGIVGTFAAGFVLIDAFGSRPTVALVAGALTFFAALVLWPELRGKRGHIGRLAVALALAAPAALAWLGRADLAGPCAWESAYYCINVRSRPEPNGPLRTLVLDRLVHSFTSLEDPTRLDYGYIRIFAEVTAGLIAEPGPAPLRSLFIGGGGYTLPRYLEVRYPAAEVDVIEIDPRVTQVASAMLGVPPDSRIRTFNQDARQFFIERQPAGAYDVVYGDAFNDFSVPYHLTTREFAELVRRALAPGGLYIMNVVDLYPPGGFVLALVATLREVFPHVVLLTLPSDDIDPAARMANFPHGERTTFVLVAGDRPIDLPQWHELHASQGVPIGAARLREYLAARPPVVLTDDYAPVDRLTAPLFLSEGP